MNSVDISVYNKILKQCRIYALFTFVEVLKFQKLIFFIHF